MYTKPSEPTTTPMALETPLPASDCHAAPPLPRRLRCIVWLFAMLVATDSAGLLALAQAECLPPASRAIQPPGEPDDMVMELAGVVLARGQRASARRGLGHRSVAVAAFPLTSGCLSRSAPGSPGASDLFRLPAGLRAPLRC